jgi:hypothetical protein
MSLAVVVRLNDEYHDALLDTNDPIARAHERAECNWN